jgi:hypothetical protein
MNVSDNRPPTSQFRQCHGEAAGVTYLCSKGQLKASALFLRIIPYLIPLPGFLSRKCSGESYRVRSEILAVADGFLMRHHLLSPGPTLGLKILRMACQVRVSKRVVSTQGTISVAIMHS